MRDKIRAAVRSSLLAIALVAVLVLPLQASATHNGSWHWHWGYNHMGSGLNQVVNSGYNYWDDQYMDILGRADNQQSRHALAWTQTNGSYCEQFLDGNGAQSFYRQTPDCGYGGLYLNNRARWISGATAYLYTDSMNLN